MSSSFTSRYSFLFLTFSLLLFSTCTREALVIQASTEGCIISENSYLYDSLLHSLPYKVSLDTTGCAQEMKTVFSNRSLSIAQDMNILPYLCEYVLWNKKPDSEQAVLNLKLKIQSRILAAITDLNSLIAEITCERERMQELESVLSDWIDKRINRATVYSILAGGLTTVIAGTIALKGNEDVPRFEQGITIAGAVAGTYWGFRSLASNKKIKYLHPRNHLKDIWERKSMSQIYSPCIWSYLTKPFRKNQEFTTGCEIILKIWEELELPSSKMEQNFKAKIELFLGNGGEYSLEDLENRLKMYEILVDEIITINYDLNRLQEEIILGYKLDR